MCGICGIAPFQQLSPMQAKRSTQAMVQALHHRGPDDRGLMHSSRLTLGHTRLAIVDLSNKASQPMDIGTHTIVFNGEIYNYRELRKQLEQLGHVFFSESDTEVVVRMYAQYGMTMVDKLNGMFAFAIHDKAEQSLVMARDRYGIKPLYYHVTSSGALLFASEIKGILASNLYTPKLDQKAMVEYFTFQNFFSDRTLHQDIHLFPRASIIKMDLMANAPQWHWHRYWDYCFRAEKDYGKAFYLEGIQHYLDQAVSRQLTGDTTIGSFLSAGLDSSSIASLAAQHLPHMPTFTLGFADESQANLKDERVLAAQIATHIGSDHHAMAIGPEHLERCLSDLVWAVEEPRLGQCYPNFYANALASQHVKVCLSGTGSDEIFGGYPWRYYASDQFDSLDNYISYYYKTWHRLIPNRTLHQLFHAQDPQAFQTQSIMQAIIEQHAGSQPGISQSMHFEATTFLESLLIIEDKMAMHHGLEGRVPFLDNDLVEFAMAIPCQYKVNLADLQVVNENDATQKQFIRSKGKRIFRESLEGRLPPSILDQPKQGFTVPDDVWFQGPLRDYVHQTLLRPDAKIYGYMDKATIHSLLSEYIDHGISNRRLLVWSLLYFEQWLATFLSPTPLRELDNALMAATTLA